MEIVNNFLWLFEIVGEATAGAGDHIMRATFTRLVGARLRKRGLKNLVCIFLIDSSLTCLKS